MAGVLRNIGSKVLMNKAVTLSNVRMLSEFKTLKVNKPSEWVYNVELNRPEKRNAMNTVFWAEFPKCFDEIAKDPDCRVVVVSGAGQMFTSGIDFSDLGGMMMKINEESDPARKHFFLKDLIARYQYTFTAIEKCNKPVIAAVHNACVGAGINLITACDIRYCTDDAWFQVKEVELGIAADVGVLQRLPKVVGNDSLVREWCYTARKIDSKEALKEGLVNRVFKDKDELMKFSLDMAKLIASKSPVAVQGTKDNLVYARDHSVDQSLDYQATWNGCMLQSEDVLKAAAAVMSRDTEPPVFSKL